MDYSPDLFEALIHEIENQGGAMLPDKCMPQDIKYRKKDGYKENVTIEGVTCGCRNESRLVSIYDHGLGPNKKISTGSGFATLCAVCDSVGMQPRYLDAIIAAEPSIRDQIRGDDEENDND